MIRTTLGTIPPTSTLIATGLTTATGIAGATGGIAAALAAFGIGAQAVPIVGSIIGGVALVISALGLGNGCGGTCVEATGIANAASQALAANLLAAQQQAASNGGCLTSAEQQVAIQNIVTIYNQVVQQCGQIPAPGGTQCIADRKPGGKYDIQGQNIPSIQTIPICNPVSSLVSGSGLSSSSLMLLGGLALMGLFLFSD